MNKGTKIIIAGLLTVCIIAIGFRSDPISITRQDVHDALKIAGLNFTSSEVDSMLPTVVNRNEAYRSLHELELSNKVFPAVQFNPIPHGFTIPEDNGLSVFDIDENIMLPSDKNDLSYYTIGQLAGLIKSQQISVVQLTTYFTERLNKHNEDLNCVITMTTEYALDQARKADAEIKSGNYKGPLHGIPYGAKDLLAKDGYPTTWGAKSHKDQLLDHDAQVIRKLEDAGAILVAKLSMGALAWGDVWYGAKTRNPWNTETGSSGSSAGSASAVSAGLVPFAIGTETLGSIVSPSTVCGTSGLRPTYGRVSRSGAMALSWSMDKIGPIARSAQDLAIVFETIHGSDAGDPSLIDAPFSFNSDIDLEPLKIGYVKSAFENDYGFKSQDSVSLTVLKSLGIELIPIELPTMPNIGFILQAEAAAAFDELTRSNKDDLLVRQIKNAWPNVFRSARLIPAVEYINANRHRTLLMDEMNDIFKQVDLYIAPSWASSSLRITNLTGHPAVVIPNGFRENGLPTSITLTGKLFDEATILAVAQKLQEATEWDELHPEDF